MITIHSAIIFYHILNSEMILEYYLLYIFHYLILMAIQVKKYFIMIYEYNIKIIVINLI